MALQTMIEELKAKKAAYDAQLAELGKQGAKLVAEFLAPMIPSGHALEWRQYTPYFNDGEACHFSVHDVYLVRAEDAGKDRDIEDRGTDLCYSAVEKYGTADEEKTYRGRRWNPRTGKDEEYEEKYVDRGFPAIEGYSVEKLKDLVAGWKSLPKDLMESAFGDHASVIVRADGTHRVDEYEHD